jgi:hypothetical protein
LVFDTNDGVNDGVRIDIIGLANEFAQNEAIRIDANNASLEEIFAALNASYGVQYRLPENLDRSISGTYTGPLAQVLFRLLQGCNFAVETSARGTSVRIYDLSGGPVSGVSVARNGFAGFPAVASPLPPRLPATPLPQPVPGNPGLPLGHGIGSKVRARAQRAGQ